jgi:iron(III) transport system permease protein
MTPVRRSAGGARPFVVAGATLLVAALVLAPLTFLVGGAANGGVAGVWNTLATREVKGALWHTVTLALVVTALALAGGTALALAFDRCLVRRSMSWRCAVGLPLLVPQFSLALSWTQAYGPSGLTDHLIGMTLPGLYGPTGIALLLVVDAVPLVWLIVAAGLAVRREPDLVRAARASGAGPWQTFASVDLPLLRRPLLAAGAVVLVGVVNSFAVPQVLGSAEGYQTLATLAYQQLSLSAAPEAFTRLCVVALVMVLLVLLCVGGADRGLERIDAGLTRTGGAGTPFSHRAGPATRLVSVSLMAYLGLTVVLPFAALAATSLTRAPGLPPVPTNWDAAAYTSALTGPAFVPLARTLALSGLAALFATVLAALLVGLGGNARRRLGTTVTLGYAVPGTALAVGVLVGYGRWLGGSAAIILVAYLGKCAALAYRAVASGADRIPPELGQAARASGASPVTVFRTVTAPVVSSGLAAAAALVMLFATHELTMSSILYGPGTETFAVVVLNQQQLGDVGGSAALAVVLTLVALVPLGAAFAARAASELGRAHLAAGMSVGVRPARRAP